MVDDSGSILCYVIKNKELWLEKILVEQDYPLLYICRDDDEQRHLAMYVDDEIGEYFVAKSDDKKLRDMISGRIPIVDIFKNSSEIYTVMSVDNDARHDICHKLQFEDIFKEDLPAEDVYLDDAEIFADYVESLMR